MANTQIIWCANTELRAGWQVRPHTHDFFHMVYVTNGKLRYMGDGEEYLLVEDDLILIPPGVVHATPMAHSLCIQYEIKFHILNQDLLQRFDTHNVLLIRNAASLKKLIITLNNQRFASKRFDLDCNDAFMSTILYSLVVEQNDSYAPHSVDSSGYSPFVNTIIRHIESNSSTGYDLADLAASLNCSKSYLCNKFRKETGATMTEYLHYIRLRGLLANLYYNGVENEISIKMMAENKGYYDPPYFNRTFKKYTGMSPTEFMEILREENASSQPSAFIAYYEKYCYIGRYPIRESLEHLRGLKAVAEKSAPANHETAK